MSQNWIGGSYFTVLKKVSNQQKTAADFSFSQWWALELIFLTLSECFLLMEREKTGLIDHC